MQSIPHDLTVPGIDAFAKSTFIMQMLCDFVY